MKEHALKVFCVCSFQNTADVVTVAQFNPRLFAVTVHVIRVFSDPAPIGVGDTVNSRKTPITVKVSWSWRSCKVATTANSYARLYS